MSSPGPLPSVVRAGLCVVLAAALVTSRPTLAMGPFEKNHPLVQTGIEAYERGDYEGALRSFDQAKAELPQTPAIEFNRGNALYKLGRFDEAKEAYRNVAEAKAGALGERDYYNLGNAWARMGNRPEAIAAYKRALTLDPTDSLARHNLEVVLRNVPPPRPQPDGGTDGGQDGGSPDAGRDGGQDAGNNAGTDGGGGQPDGGRDGGGTSGRQDGGGAEQGEREARDGGANDEGMDAGSQQAEAELRDAGMDVSLSKKEVERLLDSMRQDEKNLQLWRFQPKKRTRPKNDKDW